MSVLLKNGSVQRRDFMHGFGIHRPYFRHGLPLLSRSPKGFPIDNRGIEVDKFCLVPDHLTGFRVVSTTDIPPVDKRHGTQSGINGAYLLNESSHCVEGPNIKRARYEWHQEHVGYHECGTLAHGIP